jgi:hypothetical protein
MRMNCKNALNLKIVLYNIAVDFEILSNFCIEHFLVWRRFGVHIVGTTDRMRAFVQMNCKSSFEFLIKFCTEQLLISTYFGIQIVRIMLLV